MFIKVSHFLLLGVSGVRNYGDYTFIELFFTQNNLFSDMERINLVLWKAKERNICGSGPP